MLKMIALMRRRPDLSHSQFVDYYESQHAPLAHSLFEFERYERNFIVPATLTGGAGERVPPFPYDVVTELYFRDRDHLEAMGREIANTDKGVLLTRDEERFLDRTSITAFLVDCRQTAT